MAEQDNTQIDEEIQNLVNELEQCTTSLEGEKKVLENEMATKIEALKKATDEARQLSSLLHESGDASSNGRQKIVHVKQWLMNHKALISAETIGDRDQGVTNQKIDEFKKEVMDTDPHNSKGGFEQQMNSDFGISVDGFPGTLNPLPEEIKSVKAGLYEGLKNAREYSVMVRETLSALERFYPSTSPSNSNDINEFDNEEDNSTGSYHSGDQRTDIDESDDGEDNSPGSYHSGDQIKVEAVPIKKRANEDTDKPRKRQKLVTGDVMGSSQRSSVTSNNFSALNKKATNSAIKSSYVRKLRCGIHHVEERNKNWQDLFLKTKNSAEEGNSILKLILSRCNIEEENIRGTDQWLKDVDLESEEEYPLQSLTPSKECLVIILADPLPQSLYKRLFNQFGKEQNIAMEFHVAKTFAEAVKPICDYRDSFNLIFVDMEMRCSTFCSNSKVIEEIRHNKIHGNIVGVTDGDESEQKAFLEAGLTHCVKKPLHKLDEIASFLLCHRAQDKSSLQVILEQQMNTDLGISMDAFSGSLNPSPEEIEHVKAGLCEGLDRARKCSVIVNKTIPMLEKFFPSTLPSKSTNTDESNKEEDNRTASDHSRDQGKGEAIASEKSDNRDTKGSRERQNFVPEEAMDSSQSSTTSKKRTK